MKTLCNQIIREVFRLRRDIPIYHTDDETVIGIVNEAIESQKLVNPSELVENRPFDEMAISVFCKTSDESRLDYFYTLFINTKGDVEVACFYNNDSFTPVQVSEYEHDVEWQKRMLNSVLSIFNAKKTRLFLSESVVKRKKKNSNKTKSIKQKVVYISTQQKIRIFNSPKSRPHAMYEAHAVCGHWSTLSKINPETGRPDITLGPDENRLGKDRYGNEKVVKGKTWVNPYKTGQGKEIFETIRQWR